jgi:glutamate/tyrosine decarboxylase-like PLP-dependent enzyme
MLVRWVADLLGYPSSAGGVILSGGSLANLTAVTAAREAHGLGSADVPWVVVYTTGQTHHSIHKALRIAGLAEARLRTVATDERHRMCPEALAAQIAADRTDGLRPWLVVATAGTTDSGAVDPLDPLADIAEREGCWLHVDAAYGGFFLLTEHGRRVLRGIGRSHSVVLDPHKTLFLPWGAGMVVVRDVATLAAAHGTTGSYLQDAARAGEISPADVSPELTKPFRALRLWLPLVHLGLAPFRAALDEKLLLARYFRDEIRKLGFEVGPRPELSIVTFRWGPAGVTPDETDRMNQAILDGVRREGSVYLSSTRLEGRFTLRMAAVGHRTHMAAIDRALEVLAQQAALLSSAWLGG